MATNLLTSIYLIYYEELWDATSPRYLPSLIRHGYGADDNRWGPFDPVVLPLAAGWLDPLCALLAAEVSCASFAPDWQQGRLEICGLSSLRSEGKPLFLDGLRRMVLPLRFAELAIRLLPSAGDNPTLQVITHDFHCKVTAGLCLGGPRLVRLDALQADAGLWQMSKAPVAIGETDHAPSQSVTDESLSNQVIANALQMLNHPDVRNSLEIFLNTAIRTVFTSSTI